MKYAVNLADLTVLIDRSPQDATGLRVLLLPVVNCCTNLVCCEPGELSGDGVELDCFERRAQAVIEMIRKKYQRHELRCYQSKTGATWERI